MNMKAGWLGAIGFIATGYLSLSLFVLGIGKFYYVLAGGKKFATFPDWSSQLGIGSSYLILAILYLLWFFSDRPPREANSYLEAVQKALPFLALAYLAYPLGDDIYLYLHFGWMGWYGINPFLVGAGEVTSQLSPYVDWGQTSTYGPVSQLLFTLSSGLLPVHPLLAVYGFKLGCLACHLLNGGLIWKLLSVEGKAHLAIAYLIHPLLLMEQVGSAHVDVLISTSLVLMAVWLWQQRFIPAFLALWAGVLAKTLPILWLPLVMIFLIRQRKGWEFGFLLLGSIGLGLLLWLTVLPDAAWQSLLNPGVAGQYMASFHALAKCGLDLYRTFYPTALTPLQVNQLLLKMTQSMFVGFAGFYGYVLLRACRRRSYLLQNLLEDIGWVTLVLFLFATPWLMPWYASILLAIAVLLPEARLLGLTSLTFGLASSAQYLLQGHASLKSLVMLGIPLLTLAFGQRLLAEFSTEQNPALPTRTTDKSV